jgi:hypothetical protein
MLARIIHFVKAHLDDIILVIGVVLISLLSFAAGYIAARQQEKEPLKFEEHEEFQSSHNWSGNLRIVSGLEAFSERSSGDCF